MAETGGLEGRGGLDEAGEDGIEGGFEFGVGRLRAVWFALTVVKFNFKSIKRSVFNIRCSMLDVRCSTFNPFNVSV